MSPAAPHGQRTASALPPGVEVDAAVLDDDGSAALRRPVGAAASMSCTPASSRRLRWMTSEVDPRGPCRQRTACCGARKQGAGTYLTSLVHLRVKGAACPRRLCAHRRSRERDRSAGRHQAARSDRREDRRTDTSRNPRTRNAVLGVTARCLFIPLSMGTAERWSAPATAAPAPARCRRNRSAVWTGFCFFSWRSLLSAAPIETGIWAEPA